MLNKHINALISLQIDRTHNFPQNTYDPISDSYHVITFANANTNNKHPAFLTTPSHLHCNWTSTNKSFRKHISNTTNSRIHFNSRDSGSCPGLFTDRTYCPKEEQQKLVTHSGQRYILKQEICLILLIDSWQLREPKCDDAQNRTSGRYMMRYTRKGRKLNTIIQTNGNRPSFTHRTEE